LPSPPSQTTSGAAASAAIGHKYGEEAGSLSASLAGGVKNVGLVYIDVTGVSRKAIITSVAKGMVVGKVRDKKGVEQTVMVGGGDGGVINPADFQQGVKNEGLPPGHGASPAGQIGFGNVPPPSYNTGVGESIQGQPAAYYPNEKR
jgi:spartin